MLTQLLPNEPNMNIACFNLIEEEFEVLENLGANIFNLEDYNINRLSFGSEFFEAIVVRSDEMALSSKVAFQLKKALQKNRHLLIFTDVLLDDVVNVYEPHGFSNFSEIEHENKRVVVLKKWFILQG